MRTHVYSPQSDGLPHIACIFFPDGTLATAEPCLTREAAEEFIANIVRVLAEGPPFRQAAAALTG